MFHTTGGDFPSEPPSYDSLFDSPPKAPGPVTNLDQGSDINQLAHPVLTLPTDILSQIFVHACQPIFDPLSSNDRWARALYPLSLGRICRVWREYAWASSELWTTIIIRICPEKIYAQTDLLREWIDRAKGRPLAIYVEELSTTRTMTLSRQAMGPRIALIALLSEHSEQWQRIDLQLPIQYFQPPDSTERENRVDNTISSDASISNPLSRLSLPLLRYASISGRHAPLEVDFNHAPLLRTLSLTSFFVRTNTLSLWPTKQITHLILKSCAQIHLTELFRGFSRLTKLTWYKTMLRNTMLSLSSPIPHDRLQILNIEFGIETSYVLFRLLCLPALRSLSIGGPKALPYTLFLLPFLEQSGCALTELTLKFQVTAEYDLIDFLSSNAISSSLKELYIHHSGPRTPVVQFAEENAEVGLSRIFFDNLHPDEDPNYLPHLEVFEYEGPLVVQAIDFIEPLIIRSGTRANVSVKDIAILRTATIKADQDSEVANFTIAEYTDPQYVWEVIRMVEERVLALVNMDGTMWR